MDDELHVEEKKCAIFSPTMNEELCTHPLTLFPILPRYLLLYYSPTHSTTSHKLYITFSVTMRFSTASIFAIMAITASADVDINLGDVDIGDAFNSVTSVVGGAIHTGISDVAGAASTAFSGVNSDIQSVFSDIKSDGTSIRSDVAGAISSVTSQLSGIISSVRSRASSELAVVTADAASKFSSLSSVGASATGAALSAVRSEEAKVSSSASVARASLEAQITGPDSLANLPTSSSNSGAFRTAAPVWGAMAAGAAIYAL